MAAKSKKSKKKAARLRARKRRQQRIIFSLCAALCLVIIGGVLLSGLFGGRGDINAQPSDIKDKGMVRVNLRSLGAPVALGITLDGVYSVDNDAGFRFKKGTEISLAEDSGSILLTCGGLTIDMGASVRLTRHAPEDGTNPGGLYIHESEKDNLYAGDLLVSSTGSCLECVLTIQMEDYLYGVVGFEMSDSFPIEALKAQAIAARTYAMYAKSRNGSKSYDVTDTTQDQVFKGFNPNYSNVIKAVDATSGIIAMNGKNFANCYYTASNGGQIAATDQIWQNDVGYIVMKDDPYDLENSQSVTKRGFVPAQPGVDNPVAKAIAGKLNTYGTDYRIDSIIAVTPVNPDREGSLMFSGMEFEVSVSKRGVTYVEITPEPTQEPEPTTEPSQSPEFTPEPTQVPTETPEASATPEPTETPVPTPTPTPMPVYGEYEQVEGTVKVVLSTYKQLKSLLNIGINSQNYEVFSVENASGGFNIVARRFGHGSGMSQRGAQTMAGAHNKDCEEILAFYYPGLELYRISWEENTLTKLSALPDSVGYARAKPTPRPTQQPLPALKGSEYYARVTLQSAASTLNVRSQPSTSGSVVATLYNNERVIVTGAEADGWFAIKTVEFTGYVKGDYLTAE